MKPPTIEDYFVSEKLGFVLEDPEVELPEYYKPWEEIGLNVHELLAAGTLQERVNNMPVLEPTRLQGYRQHRRAHMLLSFICNCYMARVGDREVPKSLPRQVSIPFFSLCGYLGVKPTIGYLAIVLANWRLIDPNGPIIAENLTPICKLPGGKQYDWLINTNLEYEVKAAPALKGSAQSLEFAMKSDEEGVIRALKAISSALADMRVVMEKLPAQLDRHMFIEVFDPYMAGWGEGTPNPDGLVFDGVSREPIKARSVTAAQTSTLATIDAALGIKHKPDRQALLDEIMDYMPRSHREFILALRRMPPLRDFVYDESRKRSSELKQAYNEAISMLTSFRSEHIKTVTRYVVIPAIKHDEGNPDGETKKGNKALIQFLKSVRNTTMGSSQ